MSGRRLATVSVLVPEYDEAIAYYCGTLGFALVCDIPLPPTKRWVLVSPGGSGAQILLARAADDSQRSRIGNQTGGRVFLFLETDDFARDHEIFSSAGVTFLEDPRYEDYGTVAKFQDRFGNLWDLLEPKTSPQHRAG